MERSETKKIKTVAEQIEMRYRKLLIYLDGRVAEIDHIRFLAKTYLTSKELSSEKFLDICSNLETKGELGPNNLDLMKEFFTEDKDKDAYSAIVKAEKDIAGHTIAATITAKEIIPHTVPEDNIVIAIKTSFNINIDLINKSNLSFEERTDAMQKSASAHKEALEFCTMYDSIIRNGFCMSHTNGGSLRLFFRFFSRQGIVRFKEMYHSGELLTILQSGLITDELLDDCNAQSVTLDAKISDEDIKVCLDKIGDEVDTDNTAPSATNKDADDEYEHRSADLDYVHPSHIDIPSDKLNICFHHQENTIAFICLNPECEETFLCQKCIEESHRTHNTQDIAVVANERKTIVESRISGRRDNTLASLRQQIELTEYRIAENKIKTTTEQEKIFHQCSLMKAELDNIATRHADAFKTTGDMNEKNLVNHLECLRTLYALYEDELKQCENDVAEGSPCDIILAEKADMPVSPEIPKPPTINIWEFNLNVISSEQLEKLFGHNTFLNDQAEELDVQTNTEFPYEKHSHTLSSVLQNTQEVTKFSLESDTNCSCSYLQPLYDKLYVWFYTSRMLQLVNKSGIVKRAIPLQRQTKNTNIIDVSLSDDSLWVLNEKSCIQQIKASDGSLVYSFIHPRKSYSLRVLRNHSLIVGLGDGVEILTPKGKTVQSFTVNAICNSAVYNIAQCENTGNLALSAGYKQLFVVTENLEHLYTINGEIITTADGSTWRTNYKPERNFNPSLTCFDKDGDLIVVDDANYSVIMFNNNGQYLQTIMQKTQNDCPCAINTASDGTLWIGCDNDDFYQIKYKC